jgi:hypothetical protein
VGVCDAGTGVCSNPAKPNGAACSDGNTCTSGDSCQSGACVGGAPVPAPGTIAGLGFTTVSDLSWAAVSGATGYDVVRGTLSTLRASGYSAATDACLGRHIADTTVSDSHVSAVGDADWYLIRAYSPCGTGTYDDGAPSQAGSRDAGIAGSPNACP